MPVNFADLYKKSNNFDKLREVVGSNKKTEDARFWKPTKRKDGTAIAIIRFLMAPEGAELPFIKVHHHNFKGPNGGYMDFKCPQTIGEECPVCNANREVYSTKDQDLIDKVAKPRSRSTKYIANIYVVSDPECPENNGKVFLYEFGNQIMNKIFDANNPKFPTDPKIDAWSFQDGANFRVIMTTDPSKKFPDGKQAITYETSVFESPSQFMGGDMDKAEAIYNQEHAFTEFLDKNTFETFGKLEKQFTDLFNRKKAGATTIEEQLENDASQYTGDTGKAQAADLPVEDEDQIPTNFAGSDVDSEIQDILKSLDEK